MISAFLDALGADGPSADRAGKMDLYGRFVGSWDLDVRQFSEDGGERRRAGEWHFGWTLEGRAIQDVWIVPPRGELRRGDAAAAGVRGEIESLCATVGRDVVVSLPDGATLEGRALRIDPDGRLVVQTEHAETAVSAGDVVHVR